MWITEKASGKAVPAAAAWQGAGGVVVKICQVEKDRSSGGRNEAFRAPRWCWEQPAVPDLKKAKNKTKLPQNTPK